MCLLLCECDCNANFYAHLTHALSPECLSWAAPPIDEFFRWMTSTTSREVVSLCMQKKILRERTFSHKNFEEKTCIDRKIIYLCACKEARSRKKLKTFVTRWWISSEFNSVHRGERVRIHLVAFEYKSTELTFSRWSWIWQPLLLIKGY